MDTALARDVQLTDDSLVVHLVDGRSVTVPLAWYPRLVDGSQKERSTWALTAGGRGIHWPDLDEDISIEGLLGGRPSKEAKTSLQRWRESRNKPAD